jgi:hypothetical protein
VNRALAIALAVALGACSTMRVYTDDPRARIVIDGRMRGYGEAYLRRTGPPHTARVLVTAEDGRRAAASTKRSFTVLTLALGVYTYGVCLVACWSYPYDLFVPLPAPTVSAGWDAADDAWLRPPEGWKEKPAPPAREPPQDGGAPR